jgi:hypothetical protein
MVLLSFEVLVWLCNTPPIIQSMVFIEYLHEDIVVLLGLNLLFFGVNKGFLV